MASVGISDTSDALVISFIPKPLGNVSTGMAEDELTL
jgi:hypothetical protein